MMTRILVVLMSLGLVASVPGSGARTRRAPSPITPHRRTAPTAQIQDALKDTLVSLERQSWAAWQQRDGAFFQAFLADDHGEVGFRGVTRKAAVVAGVASPTCVVHTFTIELTRLNPATALLIWLDLASAAGIMHNRAWADDPRPTSSALPQPGSS